MDPTCIHVSQIKTLKIEMAMRDLRAAKARKLITELMREQHLLRDFTARLTEIHTTLGNDDDNQ